MYNILYVHHTWLYSRQNQCILHHWNKKCMVSILLYICICVYTYMCNFVPYAHRNIKHVYYYYLFSKLPILQGFFRGRFRHTERHNIAGKALWFREKILSERSSMKQQWEPSGGIKTGIISRCEYLNRECRPEKRFPDMEIMTETQIIPGARVTIISVDRVLVFLLYM